MLLLFVILLLLRYVYTIALVASICPTFQNHLEQGLLQTVMPNVERWSPPYGI